MAALYQEDFHAWAVDQAARLQRLATERVNSELDLENLAEEIECLAGSDLRELMVRLELLLVHLLKLTYCFYPDPRKTWINSVQAQRGSLRRLFAQSPSLRRLVPEMLENAYERAREQAETETIDLSMEPTPTENPYPVADLLDPAYIPEPRVRL